MNKNKCKTKKRFLSFSKKLLSLCLIPMVVICIGITIFSTNSLEKSIETEVEKSLQIVAASMDETYSNLYEGDYKRGKSGKITKGEYSISGDTKLIEGLKGQTGFECSLFFGNNRLITTVQKANGAPANGTSLETELYDQIREGNSLFQKNFKIEEKVYYAYYQPLINSDGSIVGALEAAMDASEIQKTIQEQTTRIIVFSLVFVIFATVLLLVLSRRMVKTMKKTKEFLAKIATGELSALPDQQQLKVNDELGDIYGISVQLQNALHRIMNDIKSSAEDLKESAIQLSGMSKETNETVDSVLKSVETILNGTVTQAEGTATANVNVIKISEQIGYITEEVEQLTEHAKQMSNAEKESQDIIIALNFSSEETKSSVSRVAEQIIVMNEAIKEIQVAISMIQSIAEQTDLLSLNASIEAARAGESGRGFAVVAEQICKLADQSNSSALDIERIIDDVTLESNKMVEIMEEVKANMDHQQLKLEETKITYSAVAEGVNNSLGNIKNIREKMNVLTNSGIAIEGVVQNLSSISEQNATSSRTTMDAAQNMSETMIDLETSAGKLLGLSDELNESLTVFKI